MSVKLKMALGFALMLVLFAISSIFVFVQFNKLQAEVDELASNRVISLEIISQMDNDILNFSRDMYAYALATNEATMNELDKKMDERIRNFRKYQDAYEPLINSADERNTYEQFKNKWAAYQSILVPLKIKFRNQDSENINKELPIARNLFNEADQLMTQLVEINVTGAREAAKQSSAAVALTKAVLIAAVLISIVLGIILATLITMSIVRPIHILENKLRVLVERGGDLTQKIDVHSKDEIAQLAMVVNAFLQNLREIMVTVTHSSEQVAAASEELHASADQSAQAANQVAQSIVEVANDTEQQVQTSSETVAIVEQMSAGAKQAATSANLVADVADKTAQAAQDGNEAVDKAIQQMATIEASSQEVADAVGKLSVRSSEIGQIVDAIANIAEQTNLLALNAAIEAARAGEAGRGFAVVADEVRKLAEQSHESTKKIIELIEFIQDDTGKAVNVMKEGVREIKIGTQVVNSAGDKFHNIQQLVNDVSVQVKNIFAIIQQLVSGSQRIVSSVQFISDIAKNTATQAETVSAATEEQSASMEEIATASENLARLAHELENAVKKFTI